MTCAGFSRPGRGALHTARHHGGTSAVSRRFQVDCIDVPSAAPMIGSRLAHYEITSHLGTGGMGEVYQGSDTKLGRSVAIKFLPEAFSHDGGRVARFQREARVLASLNHPN